AEPADEHQAEFQQAVGGAGNINQISGEDKQRDRQQHIAVEQAVQQLFGHRAQIEPRHQQVQARRDDHGMTDRKAQRRQAHEEDDADRERAWHHDGSPPDAASSGGGTVPRMASRISQAWRTIDATAKMMKIEYRML